RQRQSQRNALVNRSFRDEDHESRDAIKTLSKPSSEEVQVSTRARLLGGALSLLALLALTAAGLASAASPPPPSTQGKLAGPAKPGQMTRIGQTTPGTAAAAGSINAVGYRFSANLTPSSSTSAATGRCIGGLIHTVGVVPNGVMPSVPGCSV